MHITHKLSIVRAALSLLGALAGVAVASTAMAGARQLLPVQPGDLSASEVVAPYAVMHSMGAPNLSHDPVALSWPSTGAVAAQAAPFVAQSREYYVEASARELGAGVLIHTSAPRAVIRLQALSGTGPRENAAIDPLALVIRNGAGKNFAAGSGMEQLVTADKLAKADLDFAPGTSAFRIHPELGAGSFTLQADGLRDGDRYLINVVEPDSALTLSLQTPAANYLHGHTLVLQPQLLEMSGNSVLQRHALGKLEGQLRSPAGRVFPLDFTPQRGGGMRSSIVLDADETPSMGLWEAQIQAQASVQGKPVIRTVRLAFPVAMPVARLNGTVTLLNGADSLDLRMGVEVGAPGRYEVRGLLYGTRHGVLGPIGVAHAAQYMEAGTQELTLSFASALLNDASAPFELRDLNLLDQGRMGLLHKQQRALRIEESEIVRSNTAAPATPATAAARAKLAPSGAL